MTIVRWQTRNKKTATKLQKWCANYGLQSIGNSISIGRLYKKEQRELQKKFANLLNRKREHFHFFNFCKSCEEGINIEKGIKDKITTQPTFELVQMPEIQNI